MGIDPSQHWMTESCSLRHHNTHHDSIQQQKKNLQLDLDGIFGETQALKLFLFIIKHMYRTLKVKKKAAPRVGRRGGEWKAQAPHLTPFHSHLLLVIQPFYNGTTRFTPDTKSATYAAPTPPKKSRVHNCPLHRPALLQQINIKNLKHYL